MAAIHQRGGGEGRGVDEVARVDTRGLTRADILWALVQHATLVGGAEEKKPWLPPALFATDKFTRQRAADLIAKREATARERGGKPNYYFDYVFGRPIKIDLSDPAGFCPLLYDRETGRGTGHAARALAHHLRGQHSAK